MQKFQEGYYESQFLQKANASKPLAKTPTVSWRPQETMFVSAQLLLKVSIFLSSISEITHKRTSPWLNLTDPSWQESLGNVVSRASSL